MQKPIDFTGLQYAEAICKDDSTTLHDLCEAVTTLDGLVRIARRVLGGDHPTTKEIEGDLEGARLALRARKCAREPQV